MDFGFLLGGAVSGISSLFGHRSSRRAENAERKMLLQQHRKDQEIFQEQSRIASLNLARKKSFTSKMIDRSHTLEKKAIDSLNQQVVSALDSLKVFTFSNYTPVSHSGYLHLQMKVQNMGKAKTQEVIYNAQVERDNLSLSLTELQEKTDMFLKIGQPDSSMLNCQLAALQARQFATNFNLFSGLSRAFLDGSRVERAFSQRSVGFSEVRDTILEQLSNVRM
jgi:hypothetical protein